MVLVQPDAFVNHWSRSLTLNPLLGFPVAEALCSFLDQPILETKSLSAFSSASICTRLSSWRLLWPLKHLCNSFLASGLHLRLPDAASRELWVP